MSECISSGAKQIIGDLLKQMEPEDNIGYVKRILVKLEKMPICRVGGKEAKPKKPRKVSKWQLCIQERRKGQKWDPTALTRLSKEYKAGKCPSPAFLQKHMR